jgi:gamma-glutamylputrescine oxidase
MDLLSLNESPGAYPASYYAATTDLLPPLPALAGDAEADVCVIGAGYTGLSAALHLAQRGMKVVVLEGQRVGWGASGRNGGQLASGWRHGQDKLEAMLGVEHARLLWNLSEDSKRLVKSLVATHGIDAELKSGVLYADHKARMTPGTLAEVDHLRKAYGYDAMRFVPREEMSQLLGTQSYFSGSLDMDAGHLHPLKFVLGLARAAQ